MQIGPFAVSVTDMVKYAVGAASLASLAIHAVTEGIPRVTARALPMVIDVVDKGSAWLFRHAKIKSAVVAHEPEIQAVIDKVFVSVGAICAAAQAEAAKDLKAAAATMPPAVAPEKAPEAAQEAGQAIPPAGGAPA